MGFSQLSDSPVKAHLSEKLFFEQDALSFESAATLLRKPVADEIDGLGHVNNVAYLKWAEDIGAAHLSVVATDEFLSRFAWVGIRHEIDYRSEISPQQTAVLRTWIIEIRGPYLFRAIDVRVRGDLRFAARILTKWCLIDRRSRKPKRVPHDIKRAFGFSNEQKPLRHQA